MTALSPLQRRELRDRLELRLRRCKGDAFQGFFAQVMAILHSDNFVPASATGSHGDLKCDGLLRSPRTVFACYGPANGGAYLDDKLDKVVAKVRSDFEGALENWPDIEEWVFVTNFVEGTPPQITREIDAVGGRSGVRVSYFGLDRFYKHLLEMRAEDVEDLLGEIPCAEDYMRLQPEVVQEAVDAIAAEFTLEYLEEKTAAVPRTKLEINAIPACHARQIKMGLLGWDVVESCVRNHIDPTFQTRLSVAFKGRYVELAAQRLPPGDIVDRLLEFAVAGHFDKTERMTAAWAVIAYFFEQCTIFRDEAKGEAA